MYGLELGCSVWLTWAGHIVRLPAQLVKNGIASVLCTNPICCMIAEPFCVLLQQVMMEMEVMTTATLM